MKPTKKISTPTFFVLIRGLIMLNLLGLAVFLISCNGCGGVKDTVEHGNGKQHQALEASTVIQDSSMKKIKSIEPTPFTKYIPEGGKWDSIMYYYIDSTIEKKYELYGELWNQHNVIYPHAIFIKNPQDSFGRENMGIIIRDPKTDKVLKKINWIYEDNPFRKEGYEENERIRHYIYFKTPDGVKTPKTKLKKYLPDYLYDEIPDILTEGVFLTQNGCRPTLNGFTICQHTFEVEGIGREWIHGDYATSKNYIYDQKGNLILEYFGDCEDVTVDVDPSGLYAIIIKNYNVYKKYDGVPQKSCLEIIDLSTKKLVYEECEIGFAWQLQWTKFGYTKILSSDEDSHIRGKLYILNPFKTKLISLNENNRNNIRKSIFEKEKWIQITNENDTTEYDLINPSQFTKLK